MDESSYSYFSKCSSNNDVEKVSKLIDDGYDVHANKDEAIREAVRSGSYEMTLMLISHGANVNIFDVNDSIDDHNPLSWASTRHYGMVELLLDNGADIHIQNEHALRTAVNCGQYDIVKLLIDSGADVLSRPFRGVAIEDYKMVKLLNSYGANVLCSFWRKYWKPTYSMFLMWNLGR